MCPEDIPIPPSIFLKKLLFGGKLLPSARSQAAGTIHVTNLHLQFTLHKELLKNLCRHSLWERLDLSQARVTFA
jgi:hypothetical protein